MTKRFKFRVLRGNHSEGKYPDGHPWAGRSIVYEIGEVLETDNNLARFNAPGPIGPKFQRLYDATPATDKAAQAAELERQCREAQDYDDGNGPFGPGQPPPASDDLDAMSLQDLRRLAKEGGMTLPVNCNQADAVKFIREAAAVA